LERRPSIDPPGQVEGIEIFIPRHHLRDARIAAFDGIVGESGGFLYG